MAPPHAAAASASSHSAAASTSRAHDEGPSSSGWGILYRYPFVVGVDELLGGAEFEAYLEEPPRASSLAVSRALLLPDSAADPRGAAFVHAVDASGRLVLCSVTQGPGTERLVVCRVGSGEAFTLPEVPDALRLRLSMRDVVGIASDPRSGGYRYVVAQLHAMPPASSTSPTVASSASPNAASSAFLNAASSTSPIGAASASAPSSRNAPPPSTRTSTTNRSEDASVLLLPEPGTSLLADKHPATPPAVSTSSPIGAASVSAPSSLSAPPPSTRTSATNPSEEACVLLLPEPGTSLHADNHPATPPATRVSGNARTLTTMASVMSASAPCTDKHFAMTKLSEPADVLLHRHALLLFGSNDEIWKVMPTIVSSPHSLDTFHADTVIAYDERMWFADLTLGVIVCNPMHDQPDAFFVPFPAPHSGGTRDLAVGARRCVARCEDMLKLVVIHESSAGEIITTWRIVNPKDGAQGWVQEYQLPLNDLWEAGLPRGELPRIVMLHPMSKSCIYFSCGSSICCADLESCMIVGREEFFINIGNLIHTSLDFCCWVVPLSLAADKASVFTVEKNKSSIMEYPRMACNILQNNKHFVDMACEGASWFGPVVDHAIGFSVGSLISSASSYLNKGIQLAEKVSSKLPSPHHEVLKVCTVTNHEQAYTTIKMWKDSGKSGLTYVEFPEEMKAEEKDGLRELFIQEGAEKLLLFQ